MKGSSRNVLFRLVILISVLCLLFVFVLDDAYTSTEDSGQARSPSSPNQEILDPNFDWIYMNNRTHTKSGDYSTDIESVDYYSDGKTLNAILWLYFPFQPEPSSSNEEVENEEVNYGMYIDADFDSTTGFGGIEYKVEISWDNQTKSWTKVLEKWSHFGDTLVLENQTIPYSNFSEKDAHYVWLRADLDDMLSPDKYKVIFFGEARKAGVLLTDFTRMVAIPPLELTISTTPNSVDLTKGEPRTIEIKANATKGYEPTVHLNARSQSKYLIVDFTQNDTVVKSDYILRIPSYGVATIPLTVTSTENASTGPYTMFIFAHSSFPPEQLIRPTSFQKPVNSSLPDIQSENIFAQSSLLVALKEPLSLLDHISNFWNKVGGLASFISGLVIGLGPLILNKIMERLRNRRKWEFKKGSPI